MYNAAHSPARVRSISSAPGNQMYMRVHHCLPGYDTAIRAHIEPKNRRIILLRFLTQGVDQL
jgi:hypothetical protein